MMKMEAVASSGIKEIGHDPATNKMRVKFGSGSVYEYDDVPAEKHAALVSAKSIGHAFRENFLKSGDHGVTRIS